MSMEWDGPRMELLKRLWLSGATARTIAETLGWGVTPNAVIGKAHRLGLTGQQGSKKSVREHSRTSASRMKNQEPQARAKRAMP